MKSKTEHDGYWSMGVTESGALTEVGMSLPGKNIVISVAFEDGKAKTAVTGADMITSISLPELILVLDRLMDEVAGVYMPQKPQEGGEG